MMKINKQILLNIRRHDVRVALRENEELTQFYIERADHISSVGNIIKGRIDSVRKELNAVFVDIGETESGFLPLKDLYSSIPNIKGKEEGSEIMVQVKKEAYGTKGARLTSFIAIPGRFLVLLPYRKIVGISRNISNKKERKRLKEIAREIRLRGMGLIIRTLAIGKNTKDLKTELTHLKKTWNNIKRKGLNSETPAILWKDEDLPIKITRELLDNSVSELIIDSKEAYKKIREYLSNKKSKLFERVKLYKHPTPIFNYFRIEQELRKIFRRKIFLPSGGYIIIDKTEALTVFDINSGKYKGKKTTEEMIFKTNSEAAAEITRQLRLRDIGGIIIIDFIDMENENDENKLIKQFKSYLRRDKAKYKISSKLSPYGLLEMTRERVRRSVTKRFVEVCPYCEGKGHILSSPYLFSKFTSWMELKENILSDARIRIIANPRVAHYFETEARESIEYFCRINKMHVEISKDEEQPMETIKIVSYINGETLIEEL